MDRNRGKSGGLKWYSFLVVFLATALAFAGSVKKGSFTDPRDGKTYKTVKIGKQVWMAENLNYAYLQPTSTEDSSSFCYHNELDSCDKYGRLYLWSAVIDSAGVFSDGGKGCGYGETCVELGTVQGVCPIGWHLPSRDEWNTLEKAVIDKKFAGTKLTLASAQKKVGKMLKSKSGWYKDGNGTDEFGFSVLPAGNRTGVGFCYRAGRYANFWSSTEHSGDAAYIWHFGYGNEYVHSVYVNKDFGYSVRCLRDSD